MKTVTLFPKEEKEIRLRKFIKCLPSLNFSDTGLKNIAKRFDLTVTELQSKIEELIKGIE